jgi:hypothetical protein
MKFIFVTCGSGYISLHTCGRFAQQASRLSSTLV